MPKTRAAQPDALLLRLLCVALFGLVLTCVVFFPGYMSPDSIWQLAQARSGNYNDWHPPFMAWIWSGLDRLIPGPLGMLIFQDLLFWLAMGLLARLLFRKLTAGAVFILLIGLFPPVFSLLSTVWKDVGMGTSLLLAFSLLYWARSKKSKMALWTSPFFLFYALALRHNAAVALLPLCLWAGQLIHEFYPRKKSVEWMRSAKFGLSLFLALFVMSKAVNQALVGKNNTYTIQVLQTYDLAAISVGSGKILLPDYFNAYVPGLTVDYLKTLYDPYTSNSLYFWGGAGPRFNLTNNSSAVEAIRKNWLDAVAQYPGIYLKHRYTVFRNLMGFSPENRCERYQETIEQNNLGVKMPAQRSALNQFFMKLFSHLKYSFVFEVWLYVTMSCAAYAGIYLLYLNKGRTRELASILPALALSSSGVLYSLTYFFIAPACDFRYCWWTVISALVLCAMWLSARKKA